MQKTDIVNLKKKSTEKSTTKDLHKHNHTYSFAFMERKDGTSCISELSVPYFGGHHRK